MSILSRPRFLPQQRLDLEDVNALLSAMRTDSKLYTKQFLSSTNLIYKGFSVSGIGLKSATVTMADATLIIPQSNFDFSWFTAAPAEPNITIPDADLIDNTRNYVEIVLATENNTPLTKAFWDPEANSGAGSEFNQIVETITDLKVNMVVSTGGFSGSVDRLPLCIIDTDVTGTIKTILDRRALFGRLAVPSNIDNRYSWGTKVEPTYALTLTGVSGTFIAGEELTINTETATCTTGGTTAIAFNVPTGINFFPGSTVTGGTSGATGTVNTVTESFTGVDKNLKTQKDINDALMTEFAVVKGTRFWWENPASSIVGIAKFLESILVQNTATAAFAWDGALLSITDDSVTPANGDILGFLRMMGRGDDLALTREDATTAPLAIADGEVLYVKVPATGSRTYSGAGSADTNYQVVDIASYTSSDETYWLAYREGTRLYIRGYGELEPGEEVNIGDPELEDVLASIAANQAKANQDRTLKVIEGGTWSLNLDGDELTLSADAFIQVPGLLQNRNTISAQTISLPNPTSVAYVSINRSGVGASVRSVTVANEDAITLTDDMVVIARRVSGGVLVGAHSFLLKAGEYLEIDGALAEINRYMGQLKLKAHENDASKIRINGADSLLLNGMTLSQLMGSFVLKFEGAVVDFDTGDVFEADGVTPMDTAFTPQTIPANHYFWYGVSLLAGNIAVDNRQEANIQIDLADSTAAVAGDALLPVITGTIKLGAILVQNVAGVATVIEFRPLGVGSGSGGDGGSGNVYLERIREQLQDSMYELVTPIIFGLDEKAFTDEGDSTATYKIPKKGYEFTAPAQIWKSIQALDATYLPEERDIGQIDLVAFWNTGEVDAAAIYKVSRDGGNEFQTVTMERVLNTDAFYGKLEFENEAANQTVVSNGTGSAASEVVNASTTQRISQAFTLATTWVTKEITASITKTGSPLGLAWFEICRDASGDPGDVVATSPVIDIAGLSAGANVINIALAGVLKAGNYHLVLRTNASYLSSFSSGVTEIVLATRTGSSYADAKAFNGTIWTAISNESVDFTLEGRVQELLIEVTSSAGSVTLMGVALFYGLLASVNTPIDMAQLLADNRLGSTNAQRDRSVAGEGILLRADNGTLVECWLHWNGTTYEMRFSEVV